MLVYAVLVLDMVLDTVLSLSVLEECHNISGHCVSNTGTRWSTPTLVDGEGHRRE